MSQRLPSLSSVVHRTLADCPDLSHALRARTHAHASGVFRFLPSPLHPMGTND
nr:MAG TPA: hypothetical protein [Caudoviricetes sp.]